MGASASRFRGTKLVRNELFELRFELAPRFHAGGRARGGGVFINAIRSLKNFLDQMHPPGYQRDWWGLPVSIRPFPRAKCLSKGSDGSYCAIVAIARRSSKKPQTFIRNCRVIKLPPVIAAYKGALHKNWTYAAPRHKMRSSARERIFYGALYTYIIQNLYLNNEHFIAPYT